MSTQTKARLAVLVSGNGTNLENIIEASKQQDFPGTISVVFSDKREAFALERAKKHNVAAIFIDPKTFDTREAYDQMLAATVKQYQIDLVILAGFMRILTPVFINAFSNRIVNIHPSLLPKYPGLHAVKQALENGDSETGCTVHYVDEGVDSGPIIMQMEVPIQKGDTIETLHARIREAEHLTYPEAIKKALSKLKR